eukprot:6607070-Pyramimonas_sp.AAC.1
MPRGPQRTFQNPEARTQTRNHDNSPASPRELTHYMSMARAIHKEVPPEPHGGRKRGSSSKVPRDRKNINKPFQASTSF